MKQEKTKNTKTWRRPRHRFFRALAAIVLAPYCRWRYGLRWTRFKEQGKRAYFILMNHQTAFDQFFSGLVFRGATYYVASEDLFSNGFVSSLLRYTVAPIPIRKSSSDYKAVVNCLRVAKEGGTIAIAPEGNRTYSGRTGDIKPTIAPLARKLHLPIVIFRIEGGYGVHPRWSDVKRKGKMFAYVKRVIEPEEIDAMNDDGLYRTICDELYVDEAVADRTFFHKKSAEYLERAMFVCPDCGLSEWESHGDVIACKKCGRQVRYLPTKELEGIDKPFPFRFIADWYDYQENFVRALDVSPYLETPMYEEKATFSEVIVYRRKQVLAKDATLRLFGDRYEIEYDGENHVFPFTGVRSATVLGRNKMNFVFDAKLYQVRSGKRFNALKYVNMFYHFTAQNGGDPNDKFLGL